MPDLHTNGDLAAALRNPQDLCLDLATDLAGVRAAVDHVNRWFGPMFEDLWAASATRASRARPGRRRFTRARRTRSRATSSA